MSGTDLVRSFATLLRAPGRLALTLLGIVIGSAAIVLVMGLLEGGKLALVRANQGATGSDLILVRKKEIPARQRLHARPELSRSDARSLSAMRAAAGYAVHAESRHDARAQVRGKDKRVLLVSGSPSITSLYRLSVTRGRFLVESDLTARRRVCVIGHEIHQELFEGGTPDALTIEGTRWEVVGVLKKKPMVGSTTGTNIWDRKVIVPQTSFDARYSPDHGADRILMGGRERADGPRASVSVLRSAIEMVLGRRHAGAKNFQLDDAAGREQERLIVAVIELLLVATGALALFVGGINVMNVMLVRVSERTREIGLRRALGATRRNVLALFLAESTLLSSLGGLIGLGLGSGLVALGANALSRVFGDFPLTIPPLALLLGAGLSLVTGVVFGLVPAWRAAGLDPVAALRQE
jgi:putative ABC transport system permease protein